MISTCRPPSRVPLLCRVCPKGAVEAAGATLLSAVFPRWYIDPNRAPDDIDPDLLDPKSVATLPMQLNPGPKSKLGIGLIRRLVAPGMPLYDHPLPASEVLRRINELHAPYHRAIRRELAALQGESFLVAETGIGGETGAHGFGVLNAGTGSVAVLLDAHSMKSKGSSATPDGPGCVRPDVVVGDLDGAACDAWVVECVVETLRSSGRSVKVNDPYKGAHILRLHGRPRQGRHAVQVEVNRALYMVEATREKLSQGFGRLQQDLSEVAVQLAAELRRRVQA